MRRKSHRVAPVGAGGDGQLGDGAHAQFADFGGVGVDAHEGIGELDDAGTVDGVRSERLGLLKMMALLQQVLLRCKILRIFANIL